MSINLNHLNSYANHAASKTVRSDQSVGSKNASDSGYVSQSKTDQVNISDNSRLLQAAQAKLSQTADNSDSKVSQLKQAINEGRYAINPDKLAQKMLDFEGVFAN